MDKNIIFYFTGTGNSLKVAKDIAEKLGNCELVSMGKPYQLEGSYKRIGFIYPVYFGGLPNVVRRFVKNIDISNQKEAYFFSVCTSGAMGGGLSDIANAIGHLGGKLSYGANIKCFANYINLYAMKKNVTEKAAAQAESTKKVVDDIFNCATNKIPKKSIVAHLAKGQAKSTATKDKDYIVNDSCTGCGICAKICPVDNIKIENSKPVFLHHCEQCVACVQWCPEQAINYKDKTQSRGRYHHPEITVKDLLKRS